MHATQLINDEMRQINKEPSEAKVLGNNNTNKWIHATQEQIRREPNNYNFIFDHASRQLRVDAVFYPQVLCL